MKKVNKLLLLVLGYAAGLLSGAFIRLGFEMLAGRPTSVGGEALILPLIVLLVCFGYSVGKEVRVQRTYERGYHDGYCQRDSGRTVVARSLHAPAETPKASQR